jgi:hypothetical protein
VAEQPIQDRLAELVQRPVAHLVADPQLARKAVPERLHAQPEDQTGLAQARATQAAHIPCLRH